MVLAFHSRFVAKSREAAFPFNEGIWVSVRIDVHLVPRLSANLGIHYGRDRAGWMGKTLLLATCQVTPEVSAPSKTQIPWHFRGVLSCGTRSTAMLPLDFSEEELRASFYLRDGKRLLLCWESIR